MPREVKEKVGDVYSVRVEKTFGDYVKQGLQIIGGVALVAIFVVGLFA